MSYLSKNNALKVLRVTSLPTTGDEGNVYLNTVSKTLHLWEKNTSSFYSVLKTSDFVYDYYAKYSDIIVGSYDNITRNIIVLLDETDGNVMNTYQSVNGVLKKNLGKSAYQVALDNGFVGTESEWVNQLNAQVTIATQQATIATNKANEAKTVGFQGTWNASTNIPTLTTTPNAGFVDGTYYDVTVAGTQSITGSSVTFGIGDQVKKVSTTWVRIPNSSRIDNLGDVSITNKQDGDVIQYDGVSGLFKNVKNVIPTFKQQVYTSGSLVSYKGELYISTSTTTAGDTPSYSSKWVQYLTKKPDLESDNVNLFNKNANIVQFISGQTGMVDTYDADTILRDCNGIVYNQYSISTSHRIPLSTLNPTAIISPTSSNSSKVFYFNESGVLLGSSANGVLQANIVNFVGTNYVRFGYGTANEANIQIEYGTVSTTFQSYDSTLRLKKSQIPKTVALKVDYMNNSVLTTLLSQKSDMETDTVNVFNSNSPIIQFVSGQTGTVDIYDVNSILKDCLGLNYSQYGINMSPRIPLSTNNPTAIISPTSGNNSRVYYFSSAGTILGISANGTLQANLSLYPTTSYVRFSFTGSLQTNIQIEYGTVSTTFQPYDSTLRLKKSQIPKTVALKAEITSQVTSVVEATQGKPAKIVLPSKLWVKQGDRINLYIDNFIKKNSKKQDIQLTISEQSIFSMYDSILTANTSSTSNVSNTISLYANNSLISQKVIQINSVTSPITPKTLNILSVGDSISELGNYQSELKTKLTLDNITANFVGTMPLSSTVMGEAKSGGNMSFITESGDDAKILTVSGITTLPITSYPGTKYKDVNNNEWVVRGYKLTLSNGTYSGKLKLSIFAADPNQGGGQGGSTPSGNFPTSGTIAKSNSLQGDSTITYMTTDNAYYNPFWNPSTNQLDFSYYFTYWGLTAPDVLLMQWGYNDAGSAYPMVEKDVTVIQTATTRAIQIIQTIKTQYPNIKVVFGVEMFGCSLPIFGGGTSNIPAKKYNVLSFAEAIYDALDNATYSSYVYLVPVYANFNHKLGYGSVVTQILTDIYGTNMSVETLANGYDGVHPSNTTLGYIEEAKAYRPVFNIL